MRTGAQGVSAAGPRGIARISIPDPNNPALITGRLFTQFVWVDACGPMGLTAADALEIVLLQ